MHQGTMKQCATISYHIHAHQRFFFCWRTTNRATYSIIGRRQSLSTCKLYIVSTYMRRIGCGVVVLGRLPATLYLMLFIQVRTKRVSTTTPGVLWVEWKLRRAPLTTMCLRLHMCVCECV